MLYMVPPMGCHPLSSEPQSITGSVWFLAMVRMPRKRQEAVREEGRDRTPATPWQKRARHAPLCSAQLLGMKVKGLGANGSCFPRPPVLPLRGDEGRSWS